jgi:general secretion pathway protein C
LLGLLGLEDGDRLDAINGKETTSPEALLEAYALVRSSEHLVVRVTRGGRAVNLDYRVR